MKTLLLIFVLGTLAIVAGCTASSAVPEDRPSLEQMKAKATEACENHVEGDGCALDTPKGEIAGVCAPTPEKEIACTIDKENMPKPPR